MKSDVSSFGQPLVVEAAGTEEKARAFVAAVEEVLEEGLVTVEKVTILRFGG